MKKRTNQVSTMFNYKCKTEMRIASNLIKPGIILNVVKLLVHNVHI